MMKKTATTKGNHERYMARCLQLARLGRYSVAPNPMVGALIVYDERILGEGYHRAYGTAHAEPNAIASVSSADQRYLSDATLYVSLEPCSHYGKTPPCANLIIERGIKKVVIATLDPNPKVAGNGVKKLQQAGVEVMVGILEKEAQWLNRRFFSFQQKKRPYIILKWASTIDGFMDNKRTSISTPPLQISNSITHKLTHQMRAENSAIMIGKNTALLDNPSLSVRKWSGKSPTRIVLDRKNEIPDHYALKNQQIKTYILGKKGEKVAENLHYLSVSDLYDLPSLLDVLYREGIDSILVEGGATLLNNFIESGCWDEANIEISPQKIGSGISAPCLQHGIETSHSFIDGHLWVHYENRKRI